LRPTLIALILTRYTTHNCYTNISSILIAINPYKRLDVYNASFMVKYRDRNDRSLGPHIFASAETAYSELNRFPLKLHPQQKLTYISQAFLHPSSTKWSCESVDYRLW